MTSPVWLIAEREFRTYVATASFWVALAVGPLAMSGALALIGNTSAPISIAVRAADPALTQSAAVALMDAARTEGRHFSTSPANAQANLTLARQADGTIEADFSAGFPLTPSGRALVARILERDEARNRLITNDDNSKLITVREEMKSGSPNGPNTGALSRFALVMVLWLTLTGSLGMLLQAVVRERANRSLESLLAAVHPWEIVAGKLIGIGAVSTLVLAVWLGSIFGFSMFESTAVGLMQGVFANLTAPTTLARAVIIYFLAYIFYGLVTVALGAGARDAAAAQNMVRPMFAVLLAAFLVTLAMVSGATNWLAWVLYVPPFTPFVLLLRGPEELSAASQCVALVLMLVATIVAGWLAISGLNLCSDKAGRKARG